MKTHGAFFDKAVRQNLLGKVGRGEQHHGQPPGYYALLFSLTFWPGALASVFALPWAWRMRATREVRFLLAWIIPTWLMYEAVGTKLPHYVLPLYPALACLGAGRRAVRRRLEGGRGGARGGRGLSGLWAGDLRPAGGGGAGAGLALPAPAGRRRHNGGRRGRAALRGRGWSSFSGAPGAWRWGWRGWPRSVLYAGLYAFVFPALTPIWLGPRIAEAAQAVRPCPRGVLASTRFAEPSLVFSERGTTRLIGPAEAADLIARDPACAMAASAPSSCRRSPPAPRPDGVGLRRRAEVDGTNYSTGERLSVLIFTSASAAPRAR